MSEKQTTTGGAPMPRPGDFAGPDDCSASAAEPAEDGDAGPIGVQISVYPLRQAHLKPALRAAIGAAAEAGLHLRVGPLSSAGAADEDTVFAAVRAAFRAAGEHGPAVMVITLATRVPDESSIAAVQLAAGGARTPH